MGFRPLLLIGTALLAAYVGYLFHAANEVPSLPHLPLDEWWGPGVSFKDVDISVRHFKVEFKDEMVADLISRIDRSRPPIPPLEGVGFTYGFNQQYLQTIMEFWKTKYNFKEREMFLNQFPHFKTKIQGLDIHYIHVKPKVKSNLRVLPLLMLHGWPGSVREFYEIIPLLTTPKDGQDFVFEIIAPSLVGYGFSDAAVRPGMDGVTMAIIFRNLMHRIGIEKFYIQGGDWGSRIGSNMATIFPKEVLGYHSNAPIADSTGSFLQILIGNWFPSLVVEKKYEERLYPLSKLFSFLLEESGFLHIQSTKPDTVGVALNDSPAGLAAYILEKFSTVTNPAWRSLEDGGLTRKYDLVKLLDNLMIYWTSGTITTSMRLYAETFSKKFNSRKIDFIPTEVPSGFTQCRHELMFVPVQLLRGKYPNLTFNRAHEVGGHFAALEVPEILAQDIIDAVRSFEEFHQKI